MDKQRFEIVVGVEVEIRPEGAKLEEHEKQLQAVAIAARVAALREAAGISVSLAHCTTAGERTAAGHVVDQYAFKIDRLILEFVAPTRAIPVSEESLDDLSATNEIRAICTFDEKKSCPNPVEHLLRKSGALVGFVCGPHGLELQRRGARYVPAAARSSPGIVQPRVSS